MKSLDELRKEIDALDEHLIAVLAKRIAVVKEIGEIKKKEGLSIIDEDRRERVISLLVQKAKTFNIADDIVRKLFEVIHDHAVDLQKK